MHIVCTRLCISKTLTITAFSLILGTKKPLLAVCHRIGSLLLYRKLFTIIVL